MSTRDYATELQNRAFGGDSELIRIACPWLVNIRHFPQKALAVCYRRPNLLKEGW